MEKIIIVNEKDEIIAYKNRDEIQENDIYRVVSLWVENGVGTEVLLAQRAINIENDPGKWMPAVVAGTVAKSETYEDTIVRETEEEIGLKIDISMLELIKIRFNNKKRKYFTHKFRIKTEVDANDLTINKREIEQIKWFNKKELKNLINEKPEMFVRSMADSTERLL